MILKCKWVLVYSEQLNRRAIITPCWLLKQLKELSSGLIGKGSVFIPQLNDSRAHTLQMFYVILPGIKATVERRQNNLIIVKKLEVSKGYDSIKKGDDKPGVYELTRDSGQIDPKYKSNGRISPEDKGIVVIADSNHTGLDEASKKIFERLPKMLGSGIAASSHTKINIIYSPLGKKIGGLRNYDPRSISDANAFASLTAKAIEESNKQKDILWISELGGSAVLTQALEIGTRKGIKLTGMNHNMFMYHPRTNPSVALKYAKAMDMNVDKEFEQSFGLVNNTRMMIANAARAGDRNDSYSFNDYGKDVAKGGLRWCSGSRFFSNSGWFRSYCNGAVYCSRNSKREYGSRSTRWCTVAMDTR